MRSITKQQRLAAALKENKQPRMFPTPTLILATCVFFLFGIVVGGTTSTVNNDRLNVKLAKGWRTYMEDMLRQRDVQHSKNIHEAFIQRVEIEQQCVRERKRAIESAVKTANAVAKVFEKKAVAAANKAGYQEGVRAGRKIESDAIRAAELAKPSPSPTVTPLPRFNPFNDQQQP